MQTSFAADRSVRIVAAAAPGITPSVVRTTKDTIRNIIRWKVPRPATALSIQSHFRSARAWVPRAIHVELATWVAIAANPATSIDGTDMAW